MKMTGAEIILECLVREGVEVIFGYPGGAIMPVHDAILKYPVHHVLTHPPPWQHPVRVGSG